MLRVINHHCKFITHHGEFSGEWKTAIVQPLLKKTRHEPIHKNYRPVSNLCFILKLVGKCMLDQLMGHCKQHNLLPDFQSAYQKNYSTETSLLNIINDKIWGWKTKRLPPCSY